MGGFSLWIKIDTFFCFLFWIFYIQNIERERKTFINLNCFCFCFRFSIFATKKKKKKQIEQTKQSENEPELFVSISDHQMNDRTHILKTFESLLFFVVYLLIADAIFVYIQLNLACQSNQPKIVKANIS